MSKRKKEEFSMVEYANSLFDFHKTIDLSKVKPKEKKRKRSKK